jgi:transposase
MGNKDQATALKGTRWALLRNPHNQTGDQRTTVASIAATSKPLYRAYVLRTTPDGLRDPRPTGTGAAGRLAGRAQRSRLPEFVKLAKTIQKY